MTGTVRDATFDVLRRLGLTTIFANPGSTEITLLGDLPDDLRFVLALHEGSVVGLATGHAIATGRPALVNLHTTAGLGNAVGAIATARVNRAPLVIVVGQQDRRHLASEPFLTGRLGGLAGDYPLAVHEPARAADVPAAILRAHHQALAGRGPVLVVVPMDDWAAAADSDPPAAPARVTVARGVDPAGLDGIVELLDAAVAPALVVGAGADDADTWAALVRLAQALEAPVWQEAFGARAGFPQDHPAFAGHLPSERSGMRAALRGHDVVLVVGAAAFRQYTYEPGPFVEAGGTVVVLTDDPAEAERSAAQLAVVATLGPAVGQLAERVRTRPSRSSAVGRAPSRVDSGSSGVDSRRGDAPLVAPLRPADVFGLLGRLLPPDAVLVEESPSSRLELQTLVPARRPLGFLSAAMGGLGFGVPAAIGVKMAQPRRPVVAVVGDGSTLYGIQALWTAAHYRVGVVVVVLANGRYAVMDRLVGQAGAKAPWPAFDEVSISTIAAGLGCPAVRVSGPELTAVLHDAVTGLAERDEPLLIEVAVGFDA
jgi:benzoylformate decarboxylase